MLKTASLVVFSCVVFGMNAVSGQSSQHVIRGTLLEKGTPIVDATVYLQSFDNEKCAGRFMKSMRKWDPKSAEKLRSCMHDVTATAVDERGNYRFVDVRAGWYAVHFLWNIGTKPKPFPDFTREGSWGVMYAGHKDSAGKYDTMAQDIAFYFSTSEDVIRDFDTKH